MRKIKGILVASIIFCLLISLFSVVYAGVGARPMALGGVFVGLADDANTVYWNPAGLAQIEREVTYTVTLSNRDEYNFDDFFAYVQPFAGGTIGIGFIGAGYQLTTVELKDQSYILSYGKQITDNFSLGLNLKHRIYEKDYPASDASLSIDEKVFGLDLGLLYKKERFSLGLLIQDINEPDVGDYWYFTENIRPGIAWKINEKTTVALDIYDLTGRTKDEPSDLSQDLSLGLERALTEKITLRLGGYHFNSDDEAKKALTCGLGFKVTNLKIDYSYLSWADPPEGIDKQAHQLSLSFQL